MSEERKVCPPELEALLLEGIKKELEISLLNNTNYQKFMDIISLELKNNKINDK
jgi:hypothetical protein